MKAQDIAKEIKHLSEIRFERFLCYYALDVALIIACMLLVDSYPVLFPLGAFIIGNRLVALSLLGHDGSHGAIHKKRRLNDFIAHYFCLVPVVVSLKRVQRVHLAHHRYVNTSRDPDLNDIVNHPLFGRQSQGFWEFCINLLLYTFHPKYLLLDLKTEGDSEADKAPFFQKPIFWHLLFLLLTLLTGHLLYAALYYFALIYVARPLTRLRSVYEHSYIAAGKHETRSAFFNSLATSMLLPHNVNHHIEHHLWPSIPCYNLPKSRKLLDQSGLDYEAAASASSYFKTFYATDAQLLPVNSGAGAT